MKLKRFYGIYLPLPLLFPASLSPPVVEFLGETCRLLSWKLEKLNCPTVHVMVAEK